MVCEVIVRRYSEIGQNSVHHSQFFRIRRSTGLVLNENPGIKLKQLTLRDLQYFTLCEKF